MRTTKKILSMILAFVMVLGLLPATALATGADQIYISVSFDGKYIADKNGDPIAYIPVSFEKLASIDLDAYNLGEYKYDEDGDGTYDITALHMIIYAHENIYGGDFSDVTFTGGPGSSYFQGGVFGFDENLNYYLNGEYPLASAGWGATSDQIVLKVGDFLDMASFSSWDFFMDSNYGFHFFADENGTFTHNYTADGNAACTVKLVRAYSGMGSDATVYDEAGYEISYGTTLYDATGTATTDDSGIAEITFPSAGTWYLWADGGYGCEYPDSIVSAPAYAEVTVKETAKNVAVGDQSFATLEEAFAYQKASGAEYVSLTADLTVGDVIVPENAVLNLNGYTLRADTFDSIAPGAEVIGNGALVVSGKCEFNENNSQLPIKDAEGAFRFFAVTVKSVAFTGGSKCWFQVRFDDFDAVYALIQAGAAVDIKVNLVVNGTEMEAIANNEFVAQWAKAYNTNDSIYITAQLESAEIGETIVANPGVGANGVDITGNAL